MDTRPILIRKTDIKYGWLFDNTIPTLINKNKDRGLNNTTHTYVTRFDLFQPDELSGPWETCEYNGNISNIHTIYRVDKNEYALTGKKKLKLIKYGLPDNRPIERIKVS